jgi:hypothetical protein
MLIAKAEKMESEAYVRILKLFWPMMGKAQMRTPFI